MNINISDIDQDCCQEVNVVVTFTVHYALKLTDRLWGQHRRIVDDGMWRNSIPSNNAPYYNPKNSLVTNSDTSFLGYNDNPSTTGIGYAYVYHFIANVVCAKGLIKA